MTEALATLRNVTKKFRSGIALDGVDLQLRPGRITGLVGPNGAGKSTLMKALLGLVSVQGAVEMSPAVHGTGFSLDPPGLDPTHTVRRHLEIVRRATGASQEELSEVVAGCEIEGNLRKAIKKLSTGERQRVAIATALLGNPEILLLDEPTNGLDPTATRWLRAVLRAFADRGGAVLISSHALVELEQYIDDVVVLLHGRVEFAGELADLTGGRNSLEDAYFALTAPAQENR